eukprot:TRINITY_DN1420_c0_g5_i1.p1 TRINITY_DN1420_c0_g5~~TRINITY_DN1420_c0_g5_i1.p1  ORF type:complete len:185 (-),score=102.80 TRINITY_DN1420_c0_g5_i1:13-534(-)
MLRQFLKFNRSFSSSSKIVGEKGFKLRDISGMEVGQEFFKGRKVVLFGVPGAFTPVCSNTHVPSYLEKAEELKKAGVAAVACVSVNDPFVLKAWSSQLQAEGKVTMLSDWDASFVSSLNLQIDLSAAALGLRAKRFSILVDDGNVVYENVEVTPKEVKVSGAETILQQLNQKN